MDKRESKVFETLRELQLHQRVMEMQTEINATLDDQKNLKEELRNLHHQRDDLEVQLQTAVGCVKDAEAETRRVQSLLDQTRNTLGLHQKSENEVRRKLAELLELPASSAWVEVTKALAALPRPRKTAFPKARLEEMMDGLSAYMDEVENDRGLLREQHNADVQTIRKQAEKIEELLAQLQDRSNTVVSQGIVIQDQKATLNKQDVTIFELQQEVNRLLQEREEYEEREDARAAAATELRERTIAELEGTVQELNAVIQQRDKEAQERNETIQEHLDSIAALEATADDQLHEIHDLNEKIADQEGAIERLRGERDMFRRGETSIAAKWKAHYAELATAIGVPRIYYGNQQDPQVDAVTAYVARVATTADLSKRVEELEARLEEMTRSKPTTTISAEPSSLVLCQCGKMYPTAAAFCPSCGEDNSNVPA